MHANLLLAFLCVFLICPKISLGQGGAGAGGPASGSGIQGGFEGIDPGIMQKLLLHQAVAPIAEGCKTSSPNDVGTCIWAGLDDTQKSQIIAALAQQGSGSGTSTPNPSGNQATSAGGPAATSASGGNGPNEFEGRDLGTLKKTSDPVMKKMREYFERELREAIYGSVQGVSNKQVDHAVFNNLYETSTSRYIIEAISAYCIEINPNTFSYAINNSGPPSSGVVVTLTEPIVTPSATPTATATPVAASTPAATAGTPLGGVCGPTATTTRACHEYLLTQQDKARKVWTQCAVSFRDVCSYEKSGSSSCPARASLSSFASTSTSTANPNSATAAAPSTTATTPATAPAGNATFCAGDSAYSQRKACVVETAVREARQGILISLKIKEGYARLNQNPARNLQTGADVYSGGSGNGKTLDQLATTTSKEVETSIASETTTLASQLEERCKTSYNEQECKRFVMDKSAKESAESSLTEYDLRSHALLEKMSQRFTSDPSGANLGIYLKEAGYTDAQVQAIVSDASKREKIAATILQDYKSQREKVISEMRARIGGRSVTDIGDQTQRETAIGNIKRELDQRVDTLKSVLHYSNIVSGYLSATGSGSGAATVSTSSAALSEELNNSSFTDSTEDIRRNAREQGIQEGNSADATTVNTDSLNRLLVDPSGGQ